MDDEKKSTTISSLFNFSKYSLTTIHILVELICFLVIFLYIRRNVRKLQNQIDDLTSIIQQQQEMLHIHHKILNNNPVVTITDTNNISELFNIPFKNNHIVEKENTIVEKVIDDEKHIIKEVVDETVNEVINEVVNEVVDDKQNTLTDEDIEHEIEQEMQELKQEEEKQDDDKSSSYKKKNRRRH
jgi:hypothetical protein